MITHLWYIIGFGYPLDTRGTGGKPKPAPAGRIDLGSSLMALLITLHPCPVKAGGNVIFHLAGPYAGTATDALVKVYDI